MLGLPCYQATPSFLPTGKSSSTPAMQPQGFLGKDAIYMRYKRITEKFDTHVNTVDTLIGAFPRKIAQEADSSLRLCLRDYVGSVKLRFCAAAASEALALRTLVLLYCKHWLKPRADLLPSLETVVSQSNSITRLESLHGFDLCLGLD